VTVDALRDGGARIRTVRNLEPTLEDVFLQITGRQVRDEDVERARPKRRFGGMGGGGPDGHGPGGGGAAKRGR